MRIPSSVLAVTSIVIALRPIACPAAAPAHVWSQRFGDTAAQSIRAAAADGFGNVVTAGEFFGTVDFGDGGLASAGDADAFLALFDPSGAILHRRSFGDASGQRAVDVAVDLDGNVYTTGFFAGSVDFGGGALASSGSNDVFVAGLDSSLAHRWSKRFGDGDGQYASGIAVDRAANVYVCGYFSGQVDFGGGPLFASGYDDVFLVKFDADGDHLWSKRFGNNSVQSALDVAVDTTGNVVIAGQFLGSINFGGGDLTSIHLDAFAAKFNSAGVHLWSKRFGSSQTQSAQAVATDDAGHVYLAGTFSNTIDFGGGVLSSAGADDAFLAKLDPAGAHVWSKRFGDVSSGQLVETVAVDPSGRVMIGGYFRGSADFGDGILTSAGLEDGFAAQYASDGAIEWSARYGDSASQSVEAVTTDSTGARVLGGGFAGEIDFGGGNLTSAGDRDAFLVKLAAPPTAAPSVRRTVGSLRAFPNPFNPSVSLEATLPRSGRASLTIHDAAGRLVAVLAEGTLPAGTTRLLWSGETVRGGRAGSGVYFARLEFPGGTTTRKLVLLK